MSIFILLCFQKKYLAMRFKAKFNVGKQPRLVGTLYSGGDLSRVRETDCHEFDVKEVRIEKEWTTTVVDLVAGIYPEKSMVGPATSLAKKSLIYPCTYFKCRVGCPCRLCREKKPFCSKSNGKTTNL